MRLRPRRIGGGAHAPLEFDGFAQRQAVGDVELGGELGLPSGSRMRGWIRGGITKILAGEQLSVSARFEGAPADVAPMTLSQALDTTSTDIAVGLDVLTASGLTLRLSFSQNESEHAQTKTGALKVSGAF